jgi:radical SAM superfamily enzyme YgiQ (UPF0313 family)
MDNYSKVFLIKPGYKGSYYKYRDLPIGLGYISEALNRNGIDNCCYDLHLNSKLSRLIRAIGDFKPDLIGLSLMSFGFKDHYKLIERIKKNFPQVPIVIGGPHATTFREKVLTKCQAADYVITLEGEETIVELCKSPENISKIKGLIYRDEKNNLCYSGDREPLEDLDRVGFPKYSHFDISKYDCVTILTSRGCPCQCIYCPVPSTSGKKWRKRNFHSVIEELKYWYNQGLTTVYIVDDNFTLDYERVIAICDEIARQNLKGLRIGLPNGIRADRVDRNLLIKMKKAGFYHLAFGVEAGNNKVLAGLKKGEKIEQIEQSIKEACELGYEVRLTFLLGSPAETEDDIQDSVKLATKYPVHSATFYNILPFPNTELYSVLDKCGTWLKDKEEHLNDSSHWVYSPIFETPELSKADRIRLLKWTNKIIFKHISKIRLQKLTASLVNKYKMGISYAKFISRIIFLCSLVYFSIKRRINYRIPQNIKRIAKILGLDAIKNFDFNI